MHRQLLGRLHHPRRCRQFQPIKRSLEISLHVQPVHQPVTHFKAATRLALLGPAHEPLVGLHQVDLPCQAAIAHLFLV
ncbi:hypothetical protein D3C76_1475000 [compost metagenome]